MSYPGNRTVANISALARMSLNNGEYVFVTSVQDPWQFVTSGAAFTVDHITVEATALGGATRWIRSLTYNAIWRIGRDFWYIDPVGGNDENTGLTALTAIKTGAELARRWGSQNLVVQSGASANFAVNINLLGDIAAPDYLQLDCRLDNLTEINVFGTPTVITTSVAGATAMTAENQATNTPWSLTDAVTAALISVGDRIRWTAGAAAGGCGFAAKNLGASSWRFSQPQKSQTATFSAVPLAVNPAANNAYVVERLTHVEWGTFNITQLNEADNFVTFVTIKDCKIVANGTVFQQLNTGGLNQVLPITSFIFDQCQFGGTNVYQGFSLSNCCYLAGGIWRGMCFGYGGLVLGATSVVLWQCAEGGSYGQDLLVQGTVGFIAADNTVLGNIGIFDNAGGGDGGAGLIVGPLAGNASAGAGASVLVNALIWGTGNAGPGIHVRSNCSVAYTVVPNVTGGSDFKLGSGGKARTFVEASGTYSNPASPETWVAFIDPVQLNGNAHDCGDNAHLVLFA